MTLLVYFLWPIGPSLYLLSTVFNVYMFRAVWEFAQSADWVVQTEDPQNRCQSADWAILIAQTVEPQVLLQQPQIPPLLY